MHVEITDMTLCDAEQKAYVHWQAWRETYTELMGETFIEERTLNHCIRIACQHPQRTIVAKVDGKVIGFANYGPTSEMNIGELFALYVLREYHHQGIGYRLLRAALSKLNHCEQVRLWVLDGNEKATHFYSKCGFQFSGQTKQVNLGNASLEREMILNL
ncbi:GNAT family N-acetyltransferase [Aerococcaceae bacterium NML210727]|nr:GNAT family N-acetyltransferase [Aerococcaceae bacterium NML210727]MCW6654148.1 GNAT family N-acetyltransferase [Aerococcaceae bacterium NML201296]